MVTLARGIGSPRTGFGFWSILFPNVSSRDIYAASTWSLPNLTLAGVIVAIMFFMYARLYFILFRAHRRLISLGASESGNPSGSNSHRLDSHGLSGATVVSASHTRKLKKVCLINCHSSREDILTNRSAGPPHAPLPPILRCDMVTAHRHPHLPDHQRTARPVATPNPRQGVHRPPGACGCHHLQHHREFSL